MIVFLNLQPISLYSSSYICLYMSTRVTQKIYPKENNSEMINDENQKLPNGPRNNIQRRIP